MQTNLKSEYTFINFCKLILIVPPAKPTSLVYAVSITYFQSNFTEQINQLVCNIHLFANFENNSNQ